MTLDNLCELNEKDCIDIINSLSMNETKKLLIEAIRDRKKNQKLIQQRNRLVKEKYSTSSENVKIKDDTSLNYEGKNKNENKKRGRKTGDKNTYNEIAQRIINGEGKDGLIDGIPYEEVILESDDKCPVCNSDLVEIDEDTMVKVVYIPGSYKLVLFRKKKKVCKNHDCEEMYVPYINDPLKKTHISVSLISQIIKSKYQFGVPPYRLLDELKNNHIHISYNQGSYYYVCYNYKRYKGFKCNYNKTIREDIIDSYIKVLVNELVKTPAFIQLVADSFKVKVDSNTIDEELNKLESEYNLVNQNKKELEEDIDNLPLNLPNRNKRRAEMNERLYDMYDKLDLILNKIEECKSKKISLSNEQMTIENIKLFMYNFNEIYDECTEQERQQLIRYFFKRIDIYEDWTLEKLIKSIELNLRIHNDQKEITDILSDVPKNEVFDKLNNAKYNSNVGLEFNLEENGLLAPIYERVSLIFAEREKIKKQNKVRGPYKKKGKFSDIKEWVKENYNITIHNPQISCIKKQYGVAENGANYFQFKRGPRKETAEIIRKALIHFGVITEDMKPISSEDVSIDSITNEVRVRASHYNRKQATYPEIMAYVKETYNLSVSTLQIAQVKREYGADMQSSRKKDDARHPNIPKEKRDALVEALYHFRIIEKA